MEIADVRLVELVMPFLDVLEDRIADTQITRERLLAAMPVLKTRAATLEELARQSYFLLRPRPFRLEGKAAKPLDDEARQRLYRLFTRLSDLDGWTDEALAAELKNFAEAEEVGFGKELEVVALDEAHRGAVALAVSHADGELGLRRVAEDGDGRRRRRRARGRRLRLAFLLLRHRNWRIEVEADCHSCRV